jgi:hypothetical protein
MPQQTLQTDRITLVPLADEHFEWEVELDSDLAVMRYLSGRASTREEVVASHARRMAAAQNVDGLGFWVGLVGVRASPLRARVSWCATASRTSGSTGSSPRR